MRRARWTLLVLLALPLGCYDPNPIEELKVSPDGRWVAMRTEQGELGVLDLQSDGPLRIYSTNARRGMAWNPNSTRLAFLEQAPDQPLALDLLDPLAGRTEAPLLQDPSWKTDPAWLSNQTLAFLSDRDAEDVNIWTLQIRSGELIKLMDEKHDVARLWGDPDGGALVYLLINEGEGQLWHWTLEEALAGTRPRRLTRPGWNAEEADVAFERGGPGISFTVYSNEGPLLLTGRPGGPPFLGLNLPQAVESLAIQPGGWTMASLGRELLLWNPTRGESFWHRATQASHWGTIPLGELDAWQQRGAVLTVNRNVLLATPDVRDLDDGRLSTRNVQDLLALAYAHVLDNRPRLAREVLESMGTSLNQPRARFMLDAAWGWYERSQNDKSAARQRYQQALAITPEQQGQALVAQELLALDFFDAERADWLAADLAQHFPDLPQPTATHLPERQEFAWWLRALQQAPPAERQSWREAGRLVRAGRPAAAARALYERCSGDIVTTDSQRGMKLLLAGDFEPLGQLNGSDQAELSGLLAQGPVQRVLWRMSLRPHPAGPDPGDLRGLLLEQWAGEGDLSSARALVREDLAQPGESVIGYIDMLQQYLVNEEADRWIQSVVSDVLLQSDILDRLRTLFPEAEDQMTLLLVQLKTALVQGETRVARELVRAADTQVARLDAEAKAAGEHPDDHPGLAPEDTDDTGVARAVAPPPPHQQLFLLELMRAKLAERESRWAAAQTAYGRCLERLEQHPEGLDASVFEIMKAVELIQQGRSDPDTLESYLRVMRGMGDPLLNPTHDPATLVTAINNLETLRRFNPEPWLQPFLISSEGICRSMLGHTPRALMLLQQATAMDPPPGLLQRILLEQAALRDAQGQHALAARIDARLLKLKLPVPARASVVQALMQSERDAGIGNDRTARMHELADQTSLPPLWREWLRLQLGLVSAEEMNGPLAPGEVE